MPIDIRYHAVSLIAVFLALVLGVLVGFALVDPGQMQQFVEEVKKDNARTRQENRQELESLRQQQKVSLALEKALLPLAVKGRLAGKRIAILLDHVPDKDSPTPGLRKLLEEAGAEISAVITLQPRLARLKERELERILSGRGITSPAGLDRRSFLAARLGRRIGEGGSDLPFFLEAEGLVRLSFRSDFTRPVEAVVVVGGSAPNPEFTEVIEEPLLRALKENGRRVVGCEVSQASGAAVDFFQGLGLTTVDCIDTYSGEVALVLALGGAEGNFGIKETADRLLPEMQ